LLINTGLQAGVHPGSVHLSRFNGFFMVTTQAAALNASRPR